jgi:hypothetical protein
MAALMASSVALPESRLRDTVPSSKFTDTSAAPEIRETAFVTVLAQCPQDIPPTFKTIFSMFFLWWLVNGSKMVPEQVR